LAVAASVAGLFGVVVFHGSGSAAIKLAPSGSGSGASGASGSSGSSGGASGTSGGAGSTSTTSTLPSTSGGTRVAVGKSENYGYGVLSIKVTVQGSRITDVSVASLQTAEQYSQSLAQQVIPTLRSEVLSAQSARINGISGATYTSEAYAYSLQAALDQLHVK
jgi:uncharacterized protein with FMN-binding domain